MILLLKKLYLFLNTHNETIYIGVADDGEVIGINNVDETLNIPEPKLVDQEPMRTDLIFRILKTYLSNNNIYINDETFYKNFNLLAASGKFNKMAELLADENMESIKVAVFKGKNKSTFLKRNEYGMNNVYFYPIF